MHCVNQFLENKKSYRFAFPPSKSNISFKYVSQPLLVRHKLQCVKESF